MTPPKEFQQATSVSGGTTTTSCDCVVSSSAAQTCQMWSGTTACTDPSVSETSCCCQSPKKVRADSPHDGSQCKCMGPVSIPQMMTITQTQIDTKCAADVPTCPSSTTPGAGSTSS